MENEKTVSEDRLRSTGVLTVCNSLRLLSFTYGKKNNFLPHIVPTAYPLPPPVLQDWLNGLLQLPFLLSLSLSFFCFWFFRFFEFLGFCAQDETGLQSVFERAQIYHVVSYPIVWCVCVCVCVCVNAGNGVYTSRRSAEGTKNEMPKTSRGGMWGRFRLAYIASWNFQRKVISTPVQGETACMLMACLQFPTKYKIFKKTWPLLQTIWWGVFG